MNITERFLKYVSFPTMSDEASETVPSTAKQLVLGKYLAEELTAMGLSVPQVTKIFTELKRRGFDVADNIFTVEQAKTELLRLLGKAGGNNA